MTTSTNQSVEPSNASSGGPIKAYRRYWLPELVVFTMLAIAAVFLFAVTDLDIATVHWFHHSDSLEPWPYRSQPLWSVLYRCAPWVTGSLAIAGIVFLLVGVIRSRSGRWRWYGYLVLLSVAIGPGLIVNGLLKDHWGRPRPRQTIEFGGRLEYVPPLVPACCNGKSFPCGHCSVGFLYGIGWWLWRRTNLRWAAASLAVGTVLGTLLGLGRMAAGGHFLSDIVWSQLIALGVAHALYYYVLRIPAREDGLLALHPRLARNTRWKSAAILGSVVIAACIILGGTLATPHYADLSLRIQVKDQPVPPERLEVVADTLDVVLRIVKEPNSEIVVKGYVHGFGLPTNRIRAEFEFEERPLPTLRYLISARGWFTDLDGVLQIRVPVDSVQMIVVRVKRGEIRVEDKTGGLIVGGRLPVLDLRTGEGQVKGGT